VKNLDIDKAAEAISEISNREAISRVIESVIDVSNDASDVDLMKIVIKMHPVKSQGDLVVVVLNVTHAQGISVTGEDLTRILSVSFPKAKIGERHGPHYMSMARNGKLKGLVNLPPIPHARRSRYNWRSDIPEEAETVRMLADDGFIKLDSATSRAHAIILINDFVDNEEDDESMIVVLRSEISIINGDFLNELQKLSRKDLVQRAVDEGVNAGGKTDAIIERIVGKYYDNNESRVVSQKVD